MIHLPPALISDDLREVKFCCDLDKCGGACCIEGDAGAPLEEEEISQIEDYLDEIEFFMTPQGVSEVRRNGVFDYDVEGRFVTPLVNGRECAFIAFQGNIARCAIELAYQAGRISFPKPLSCHLYPVRITSYNNDDRVNYHAWHICLPALEKGRKEGTPLYLFLKEALIRKYGERWYKDLIRRMHQRR